MKGLRTNFRYHRYLCPATLTLLEGKNPRSSASSKRKTLFHLASQQSFFHRKPRQAFCNISSSQACPLPSPGRNILFEDS